jgi:hypothetical protein
MNKWYKNKETKAVQLIVCEPDLEPTYDAQMRKQGFDPTDAPEQIKKKKSDE